MCNHPKKCRLCRRRRNPGGQKEQGLVETVISFSWSSPRRSQKPWQNYANNFLCVPFIPHKCLEISRALILREDFFFKKRFGVIFFSFCFMVNRSMEAILLLCILYILCEHCIFYHMSCYLHILHVQHTLLSMSHNKSRIISECRILGTVSYRSRHISRSKLIRVINGFI